MERSIRSRKPDAWPPQLTSTLLAASKAEVFIPFENKDRIRSFRQLVKEVRRSYREHDHPDYEAIAGLRLIAYTTADILSIRPAYDADRDVHPFTVCISPSFGFLSNLEAATHADQISGQSGMPPSVDIPPPPPAASQLSQAELDRELERQLEELYREELSNHGNEAIEFLKSRRGK